MRNADAGCARAKTTELLVTASNNKSSTNTDHWGGILGGSSGDSQGSTLGSPGQERWGNILATTETRKEGSPTSELFSDSENMMNGG